MIIIINKNISYVCYNCSIKFLNYNWQPMQLLYLHEKCKVKAQNEVGFVHPFAHCTQKPFSEFWVNSVLPVCAGLLGRDVKHCELVVGHQRFAQTYCLHLQSIDLYVGHIIVNLQDAKFQIYCFAQMCSSVACNLRISPHLTHVHNCLNRERADKRIVHEKGKKQQAFVAF